MRQRLRASEDLRDCIASGLIALLISLLLPSVPFQLLDGWAFDTATTYDHPTRPQVIVIERADEVDPAALLAALESAGVRALGLADDALVPAFCRPELRAFNIVAPSSISATPGAYGIAADDRETPCEFAPAVGPLVTNGITRRHAGFVAGPSGPLPLMEPRLADRENVSERYYPRMPATQNVPRIDAQQIVAGAFADDTLRGFVALASSKDATAQRIATPLDPGARFSSPPLFSAYAVQSLIDRREIVEAGLPLALILLLSASLAGRIVLRRPALRRRFLTTMAGGTAAIAALWLVVIQSAHVLLPLTAMLLALIIGAITKTLAEERGKDRRLERTMANAINLSFERSVFHKSAEIPAVFEQAGALFGLPYARMEVRSGPRRAWEQLFLHGVSAGPVRQSIIADPDRQYRFAYALPAGSQARPIGRILDDAVSRLQAGREWQSRLLAAEGTDSIDSRLRSASNLIAIHSDELARGLDALDTGVFVFRPLGTPIHANAGMRDILGLAGIDPDTVMLVDTLTQLADLEVAQARSMVRETLLCGTEMRVPMRDLGARQRILRLGIASQVRHRAQTVLVLEAVDITELDRLAELRLAIGTFIDRHLRNDLEAIALGTGLARDSRLDASALGRILDRIAEVTDRASTRLDDVRDLLEEEPGASPDACYPIEAGRAVQQALDRAAPYAAELGVTISSAMPAIGGFSIAEPLMLSDTIEAMLRIVIADTAQGGSVVLSLSESEAATLIEVSGGFGLPFDRFMHALDARAGEVPSEYQIAAAGIAETLKWRGEASYWSAAGKGFRFTIRLRRV